MNDRSRIFLIAVNLMLVFFLFRLFKLQVQDYPKYAKLASDNAARTTPILAPRGIIFDRNGKVMLKNRPVFMLYVLPHLLPKDPTSVFEKLGSIMGVAPLSLKEKYRERKTQIFEGVLVASNLPVSIISKIEEERESLPGVEVICYSLREYPHKKVAPHVLGYVGEIEPDELYLLKNEGYRLGDLIGKDGVEKQYDKYLRGISGGKKIEVDAHGKPVKILDVVEPVAGDNLVLTVDLDLQKKADEVLREREGAVVVLDPRTGEILAMASHPAYDALKIADELKRRTHPFMNRALSTYPPGSTFKVVTLSAALQEAAASTEEVFRCLGYYKLGLRIAKCWLSRGHGSISPIEGLVWSCDIVFYELGRRLGPDILNKYAGRYGLGQKTGIDLPQEKKGFVPTSSWKKEKLKENWYEGDSINMGIGQGFIQVTPLQMALLYAEVATGFRMKPYIVRKVVDKAGKTIYENTKETVDSLPLSPNNVLLLRNALKDVVLRGTGVAAYVPGIEASGKTGTAENPRRAHAWFICYAPFDDPEIVISVFVAHGEHGDRISAYIARDILKWYKENRL